MNLQIKYALQHQHTSPETTDNRRPPAIFAFLAPKISELIMGHDIKTIKQAGALVLHTWRGAAAFFLSIELGLVVLAAFATVGGVWLAAMGDVRCLLAFGVAGGYLALRAVLHVKRILAWPFI
jgi:hypothetical protein